MHPNPVFHTETDTANLDFARSRGFGQLCVNGPDGPFAAHIPFRLSDDGQTAELHLMRSNPILGTLGQPAPALLAVSGPDAYISPDWYDLDDQVPTWNYVAVHLRGTLERLPQEELRGVLDRLSELFETRLLPKKPWTNDKMPAEALARMMRMIVPCRMHITAVDGTWKLSQNKPDAARINAAGQLQADGNGQEIAALARMMRAPGQS